MRRGELGPLPVRSGAERALACGVALALGALVGCGGGAASGTSSNTPPATLPSVSVPLDLASGSNDEAAPAPQPEPEPKAPPQYAPDPEPLRSAEQYEVAFRYERGQVKLESATKKTFAQPLSTARRLGRFALELWVGHELVERVRFDFPLLAAPPRSREDQSASSLEAGLTVTEKVLVPVEQRATRAILVDRATGEQRELSWPPVPNAAPAVALPVPPAAPAVSEPSPP